ncbi:MAG: gamma-glutamyl-gamma-aminobutyrate hydrolase family protein [Oligoflexia bacterium]|nr:gamma-glutamyl-gamma-aminobutyrate hydrolase family protein [Oligoflexia bacterium]
MENRRNKSVRRYLYVFLSLCASITLPKPALAEVTGLLMWTPDPKGITYLFPKIKGKDAVQVAADYLRRLKSSPVYGPMEDTQEIRLQAPPQSFRNLPEASFDHPRVAVLINRPKQMTAKSAYMKLVFSAFQRRGSRLFTIPLGLETVLSPKEMKQVEDLVARDFNGFLGVGGDDVHPALYNQSDTRLATGDISLERDSLQLSMIKNYLSKSKGRLFLICRSTQLGAVATGRTLYPDIHAAGLTQVPQRMDQAKTSVVLREVVTDPNSELAQAAGSSHFITSNSHHAAVNPNRSLVTSPSSSISAYNIEADGTRGKVVKAIDLPANAGMGVQFHPEFENSPEESRILDYVTQGWKLGRVSPKQIVNCLVKSMAKAR